MTHKFAAMLVFVVASLVAAQAKKDDPKKDAKNDPLKMTKEEQAILDLTNAERKKADLKPLAPNPQLMTAARGVAAFLAKQGKPVPKLDAKELTDQIDKADYKGTFAGTNVSFGKDTPKKVFDDWLEVKPYKENILREDSTEVGVGFVKSPKGVRYWVEIFGASMKMP